LITFFSVLHVAEQANELRLVLRTNMEISTGLRAAYILPTWANRYDSRRDLVFKFRHVANKMYLYIPRCGKYPGLESTLLFSRTHRFVNADAFVSRGWRTRKHWV
jgi:hypothetical protein